MSDVELLKSGWGKADVEPLKAAGLKQMLSR
jgi:hypothetical protein